MIRFGIAFLLLSLTAFGATRTEDTSDNSDAPPIHFGPLIGVNLSNARTAGSSSGSSAMLGFSGGIFLETPVLTSMFTAQPEVKFIQQGASNSLLGPRAEVKLNYVEVPFLFKLRLPGFAVKPNIFGGPKLAYLLSASGTNTLSAIDRGHFHAFDFGFDVGIGFDFNIAQVGTSFFSARYGRGLISVDPIADWKNESFQMLVGVYL